MPEIEPTAARTFAEQIVAQLQAAGYEALWAGGCVRDQLLGLTPKDYDVATSALPDQVQALFGKKRTLAIGASFGVITVLPPRATPEAGQIEVATFRADVDYQDGRRPESVKFTDARHDASRRDFTINGLFYKPDEKEIVDYVGGREDLERKIIRAIGNPAERFGEDKLRMLRAVRFAATLDFKIAPTTAEAIRTHASELQVVSAERIGMELRRMLIDKNRCRAMELMAGTHLITQVLPELLTFDEPQTGDELASLGRLHDPSLPLAFACLLQFLAAPSVVRAAARRLKFTKKEAEQAGWLTEHWQQLTGAATKPWSVIQPLLANEHGTELVSLHEAITGSSSDTTFCREKLALPAEQLDPPPLITGADLLRNGIRPGPQFSALLAKVRSLQLDEKLSNASEAIDHIQSQTT